jgi:hypothetical protein
MRSIGAIRVVWTVASTGSAPNPPRALQRPRRAGVRLARRDAALVGVEQRQCGEVAPRGEDDLEDAAGSGVADLRVSNIAARLAPGRAAP